MSTITLERLTKLYPGGRGVRDLDLAVGRGEVFGFIGPNGAGKSTTLRTMLGLISPTAGRARILGLDARVDGPTVRARVGYLPSEPRLYDGMSVGAILAYLGRFFTADTAARRRELAEMIELDLSRRAEDLSIGNKKKVALVAALQHTPEVLILDEPTSGLDPLIQARFFEVIQSERARGTTVFFSSHVMSEVERLCDRVAIIRDGRIVELARMTELRARQFKRVRARLDPADAAAELLGLAGVRDPVRDGERLSFVYQGDMRRLLGALAGAALVDVTIEEPSLEEIVLSHYGKGSGDG
jgi:ABC-2 type transport system ATP-binding protein